MLLQPLPLFFSVCSRPSDGGCKGLRPPPLTAGAVLESSSSKLNGPRAMPPAGPRASVSPPEDTAGEAGAPAAPTPRSARLTPRRTRALASCSRHSPAESRSSGCSPAIRTRVMQREPVSALRETRGVGGGRLARRRQDAEDLGRPEALCRADDRGRRGLRGDPAGDRPSRAVAKAGLWLVCLDAA